MKYLRQFCIILCISALGELLGFLLPLPVPGSIYGIVLMFAALCTGILRLSDVKECSRFLLEIMPVMFIPAAVGLMNSWDIICSSWLSYLVILLVTTVGVMAVSGLITQFFIRKGDKHE